MSYTEAQFRALGTWWADTLFSNATQQEKAMVDNQSIQRAIASNVLGHEHQTLTAKRAQFINTFVAQLTTKTDSEHITVRTEYKPDEVLDAALQATGFDGGEMVLPFETVTYLQSDGRIFVPNDEGHEILHYEEEPADLTPYRSDDDIDLSQYPTYRDENIYLITDLVPGRPFATVTKDKDGLKYREETIAGPGLVLVIPKHPTILNFDALTSADAFNLKSRPDINSAYKERKEKFQRASGFGTWEKMDDKGHYRLLGLPFHAQQIDAPIAIGRGRTYEIAKAGDFLTKEVVSSKILIIKKELLDEGWRTWLPCDEQGNLVTTQPAPPECP